MLLNEEMGNNLKMVAFGEDIADGKGGVFTATKGLLTKYGSELDIQLTTSRSKYCWCRYRYGIKRVDTSDRNSIWGLYLACVYANQE